MFTTHTLPNVQVAVDQYVLMTLRSHDQYNTTVYGHEDRYRGLSGSRRVLLMNQADIEDAGLSVGDRVDLVSHFEGQERVAPSFEVVAYDIPRSCVATYFPEANILIPVNSFATRSFTPTSKSVVVSLKHKA